MNAALPQLASYGSDAVDMFFDLERQAQRTGLAVGDLISIAGNYRTFDSAAEAAGNLNAVLGTQLFSTMGLLEAQLEGPEAVLDIYDRESLRLNRRLGLSQHLPQRSSCKRSRHEC